MNAPRPLVVHPGLFSASVAAQNDLAGAPGRVLFHRSHVTWSDLVGVMAQSAGLPLAPSPRGALRLALKGLLDLRRGDPQAGLPPLAQLLDPLFAFFLALDQLPASLRDRAPDLSAWPEGGKGAFLGETFRAWRAALAARNLHTDGDVLAAYRRLSPRPSASPEGAAAIVFRGFVQPTPLAVETMLDLAGTTPVTFAFRYHHDRPDLYSPLEAVLKAIEASGADRQADVQFEPPPLAQDADRAALAARLFAPEGGDSQPCRDSRLRVVFAPDRAAAVRAAGERIRSLLDAGTRPGDIAVVAPDLDGVRPYLREAIRDLGLPLAYHRLAPVLAAPCFRFVHRLAELAAGPVAISPLAALAREARSCGLGPAFSLDGAEAALRRAGVERLDGRDAAGLPAQWTRTDEPERRILIEAVNSWLNYARQWRTPRPLGGWLSLWRETLSSLRLTPFASPHDQRHFALSWHALETARRVADEWLADGPPAGAAIDGAAFFAWLEDALDAAIRLRSSPEP
ncbi:MAG: hypothetical protein C4523_19090, partial [Myxococcales bacterium]